jgi:hypothetical protein
MRAMTFKMHFRAAIAVATASFLIVDQLMPVAAIAHAATRSPTTTPARPTAPRANKPHVVHTPADWGHPTPLKTSARRQAVATSPYPAAVLADHPAAYWRLGETSGTTAVDQINTNGNGTYTSGTLLGQPGALLGDSSTSISGGFTAPDAGFPSADTARTVEFWFRSSSGGVAISYGDVSNGDGFAVTVDGNASSVTVSDGSSSGASAFSLPFGIHDGGWHLIDASYDGSNATVSLDGQTVGYAPMAHLTTKVASQLWSAGAPGLQEVAIYPTALTPVRIAAHWTAGGSTAPACSSTPTDPYPTAVDADHPAVAYRLGELYTDPTGRVAFDTSGNCVNGAYAPGDTAVSGATVSDTNTAISGTMTASAATLPPGASPRTVEFWMATTSAGGGVTYGDVSHGDAFSVSVNAPAGVVGVSTGSGSAVTQISLPYAISNNEWHLIDVTFDGSIATAYLDGQATGWAPLGGVTTKATGSSLVASASSLDEVAVYPAALSAERISAHWMAGSSSGQACRPTTSGTYPFDVQVDSPVDYYRLGELSTDPTGRVAFDAGSGCVNGAYVPGDQAISGALRGDADTALSGTFMASAAHLPAGDSPRTLEFWVAATSGGDSVGYGDASRGDAFDVSVDVSAGQVTVSEGSGTAATVLSLPYAIADGNWHLIDVTFDGSQARSYVDGVTGTAAPLGGLTTSVTGSSLVGSGPALDEVAVYATAMGLDRLASHFIRGHDPAVSAVYGTVTLGDSAVPGALVQICSTSGSCASVITDSLGRYRFPRPYGTYALAVFPPASGFGSTGARANASATTTASAPGAEVDIALSQLVLPPGSSLTGPSHGTQTGDIPVIYWGETNVYATNGCPNGFGVLQLTAIDSSTGQAAHRFYLLSETSPGSGHYTATIPPLAPLHGAAQFNQYFYCQPALTFTPQGGPENGGTTVYIHNADPRTITGVQFGSAAGTGLTELDPSLYQVTSPAGSGDTTVVATYSGGGTSTLGSFHYVGMGTLSPSGGPADGGGTVTINGSGFVAPAVVVIGGRPSNNTTVVSPTEIVATVPPGQGTAPITVVSGGGYSNGGEYTYSGLPSNDAIKQWADDIGAFNNGYSFTHDLLELLQEDPEAGGAFSDIYQLMLEKVLGLDDLPPSVQLALNVAGFAALFLDPLAAAEIMTVLDLGAWFLDQIGAFDLLIDPSGEVVDEHGVPVSGATVTLLRQGSSGFTPVPNGDQSVSPPQNPLTTPSDGTFSWEATAATYEVTASSPSCVDQTGNAIVVTSAPFTIPPPKTGIVLTLPCALGTVAAPTVNMVSPSFATGAGGSVITVSGAGLTGATSVTVGGVAAEAFQVLSDNSIQVTAPAGTGAADVVVTTPAGTSPTTAADQVTFVKPPTLMQPASVGRGAEGFRVTFTGAGFTAPMTIQAGNGVVFSKITVVTPTQVKASVRLAAGASLGTRDVVVSSGTTTMTCRNCLTVVPPPQISSGTPVLTLGQGASQPFAVNVTGVSPPASVSAVGAGSTIKTKVVLVTPGTIYLQVTVGHTAVVRSYDLRIVNSNGGQATLVGGLVVVAGPAVSTLSPSSVARATTVDVTITGSRFTSDLSMSGPSGVSFAGIDVASSTSISAAMTVSSTATPGTRLPIKVCDGPVGAYGCGTGRVLAIT